MEVRAVELITTPLHTSVGPFSVAQPLPTHALRYADPFLLLHHAGPHTFPPGSEGAKIEAHPHRGFEPVTFVFQGSVLHRDSLGNQGVIGAGEVQWITSGSGIVHEEGPTPQMARDGGTVELIQLWVNLPAQRKMMQPAYQELRTDAIPSVQCAGGAVTLHVVSGELHGVRGPAITQSSVITAMGTMQAGGRGVVDVPPVPTVVLYVLSGRVRVNHTHVAEGQRLVMFGTTGTGFHVDVEESGSILLLAGEPLNEPMVQYGPFVMNTEEEIREAFRDVARGAFGTL